MKPSENTAPIERHADSIQNFCIAHDISRGTFYKLAKQGKAPKTIRCGRRRLITREAAADWRQEMEADA